MPSRSYGTLDARQAARQFKTEIQRRRNPRARHERLLGTVRLAEERIEAFTGKPIAGLRILELGPGQGLERSRYFAVNNDVVGMDLDVIPVGWDVSGYYQMLKDNGAGRVAKTIGRRALSGRAAERSWAETAGVDSLGTPRFVHGDICKAPPPEDGFDLLLSWAVWEHLAEPDEALVNAIEALKPGGVLYLSLHLYTSNTGHHDIRAFTGARDQLPPWGHLRESTKAEIRPSAYLNEWRLPQWRALFAEVCPGAEEFLRESPPDRPLDPDLRAELADYTDEELHTLSVTHLWRKPES